MGTDSEQHSVTCCLCRGDVDSPSGWCQNCRTYPINITPIRYDDIGHHVDVSGWCYACERYRLTELEAKSGQWIDTGKIPKRLEKRAVHELVGGIVGKLSGAGWPDVHVPLRREFIPRRWRHVQLEVVGQTPLGYEIVDPAGIVHSVEEEDNRVPF